MAHQDDPPSVDFLLLTYNQEAYVRTAIEAALAQAGPPLHILISDDASTDGTWAEVEATVAGYAGPHRLTLNRNPVNLGIAGHINQCIARTSGRWIIAAAGDDISRPDRAGKVRACFEATDALLVHSAVETIDEAGRPAGVRFDVATFFTTTDPIEAAGSFGLYVGATGAWSRTLFDKYGPLPLTGVYEDLVLGFRAALEGRIARIDEPLVAYRWGVGVSQETRHESLDDWRAARRKTLARDIRTTDQRRVDATRFGLGPDDPVVRRLNAVRADLEAQLAVHEGTAVDYFLPRAGTPIHALRIYLAERKRARRRR
jgi:glycosyltransferase involved in cell wall biosynthesis